MYLCDIGYAYAHRGYEALSGFQFFTIVSTRRYGWPGVRSVRASPNGIKTSIHAPLTAGIGADRISDDDRRARRLGCLQGYRIWPETGSEYRVARRQEVVRTTNSLPMHSSEISNTEQKDHGAPREFIMFTYQCLTEAIYWPRHRGQSHRWSGLVGRGMPNAWLRNSPRPRDRFRSPGYGSPHLPRHNDPDGLLRRRRGRK